MQSLTIQGAQHEPRMRQSLDSEEISTLINCKPRISAREDDREALIGRGAGAELCLV